MCVVHGDQQPGVKKSVVYFTHDVYSECCTAELLFVLFFEILHTSQHVAGDGAQRLILRPTTVSTVHLFGPLIHIHAHVAAQRNKLPLNIIPRLIPDVVTAPVLPAFFCDLVLILFDPSFCLGGICTEMKIVGTAASTLDLTTPTPPHPNPGSRRCCSASVRCPLPPREYKEASC